MATYLKSANFSGANGSHFYISLFYDISQNTNENKSYIRYYLYLYSKDGYSGSGSAGNGYINKDSNNQWIWVGSISSVGKNSENYIGYRDEVINHNADGTGSAYYQAYFHFPWTNLSDASLDGTITLPTIPRASSISATDANVEEASTININRASSSFTHTLEYSFDGLTGTIVTKTSQTSYSWIIPEEFYSKLTSTKYDVGKDCTITCKTYNGNTLIGSSTKTIKIKVNPNSANTKPTVSATIEVDNTTKTLTGKNDNSIMIRGVTNATVTVTATPQSVNGTDVASITSKSVVCGSKSLNDSGTLQGVDSGTIIVSAVDSRGISNSVEYTKILKEYVLLTLNPTFYRTNPTNGQIALIFNGNYFNDKFGDASSTANTLNVKYRYKEATSSTWSSYTTLSKTITNNTYSNGSNPIVLGNSFDYTKEYDFEMVATDKVGSVTMSARVTQGIPVFDWGKNDFQFNVPVYLAGGSELLEYDVVDTW